MKKCETKEKRKNKEKSGSCELRGRGKQGNIRYETKVKVMKRRREKLGKQENSGQNRKRE